MQNMDDTMQRGKKWNLLMGVMSYLDTSLVIVEMEELRTAMEAKSIEFDPELVKAMVNNGNIACYEAQKDNGQPTRYFCSVKFEQTRSID